MSEPQEGQEPQWTRGLVVREWMDNASYGLVVPNADDPSSDECFAECYGLGPGDAEARANAYLFAAAASLYDALSLLESWAPRTYDHPDGSITVSRLTVEERPHYRRALHAAHHVLAEARGGRA